MPWHLYIPNFFAPPVLKDVSDTEEKMYRICTLICGLSVLAYGAANFLSRNEGASEVTISYSLLGPAVYRIDNSLPYGAAVAEVVEDLFEQEIPTTSWTGAGKNKMAEVGLDVIVRSSHLASVRVQQNFDFSSRCVYPLYNLVEAGGQEGLLDRIAREQPTDIYAIPTSVRATIETDVGTGQSTLMRTCFRREDGDTSYIESEKCFDDENNRFFLHTFNFTKHVHVEYSDTGDEATVSTKLCGASHPAALGESGNVAVFLEYNNDGVEVESSQTLMVTLKMQTGLRWCPQNIPTSDQSCDQRNFEETYYIRPFERILATQSLVIVMDNEWIPIYGGYTIRPKSEFYKGAVNENPGYLNGNNPFINALDGSRKSGQSFTIALEEVIFTRTYRDSGYMLSIGELLGVVGGGASIAYTFFSWLTMAYRKVIQFKEGKGKSGEKHGIEMQQNPVHPNRAAKS